MEDKMVKMIKTKEVVLYTKDELFEDIQTTPEECAKENPEGEKARRDFIYKLKVLQSVFNMKLPMYDIDKDNIAAIKERIEGYVDGDELLFDYTFFLSSNRNFDYSWSYLRKQIGKYVDFLSEVYRFISCVIADINTMKTDLSKYRDLHIVFNELFDVAFIDEKPFVKTVVCWNNFYQINEVKNGYYTSVKIGESTLLICYRKYNSELNPLLDKDKQVLAMLKEESTIENKV